MCRQIRHMRTCARGAQERALADREAACIKEAEAVQVLPDQAHAHLRHGRRVGGRLQNGDGGRGREVDRHPKLAVRRLDGRKGEVVHARRRRAWIGAARQAARDAVLQRYPPRTLPLRAQGSFGLSQVAACMTLLCRISAAGFFFMHCIIALTLGHSCLSGQKHGGSLQEVVPFRPAQHLGK